MIIVDSTIPPTSYPRQDYQVLAGLGASNTTTAVGLIVLFGAALFTVHYFFPSHARAARRARNR